MIDDRRHAALLAHVHDGAAVRRPARRGDEIRPFGQRHARVQREVPHLDGVVAAGRPVRHRDATTVGRPARLGVHVLRHAERERRDPARERVDAHERGARRSELHGDDLAVAAHVGLDEPRAVREPRDASAALDVQIGADDVGAREVELREEVAAARHRHAGAARVATSEPHAPSRRRDEVRRVGLATVAAGVDERRVVHPARRGGEEAVRRQLAPAGQRIATRRDAAAHRVAPLRVRAAERHAERAARRGVEPVRDELRRLRVDEAPDARFAVRAREPVDEQRAVAVRRLALGEARGAETQLVQSEQVAFRRAGARVHAVQRVVEATARREARLLVHGEPLGEPRRAVRVGKEVRRAPEHALRDAPDAARPIELEDVRQLVRDDELQPVLVEAEPGVLDRRHGEDDDPVRRRDDGVAVGVVRVVGDEQVDASTRRRERRR